MTANNRELSQFGSFIHINDPTKAVGIATEATPFVGIGTTSPTSKLTVIGDTNISGVVTATAFYGDGSTLSNVSAIVIDGWSVTPTGITTTVNVGVGTTAQPAYTLDVAGDINFTGTFYEDGSPFVASRWSAGAGTTIYRSSFVGIETATPTEKLHVVGNTRIDGSASISGITTASSFVSTVSSGTSPLTVTSTTLVTNLNADLIRGRTPPAGDFVGTTDTQTLSSKTLTSPRITGVGASFFGSTSGYTVLTAAATASGTLTLPAETGTLLTSASVGIITTGNIANNTILNEDINSAAAISYSKLSLSNSIVNADVSSTAAISYGKLSLSNSIVNADIASGAAIAISKLAASTISGVSLGNNLNTLTFGTYLTGTSYNGSSAVTIGISASNSGTSNIVARDASGNFSAGTITANLIGDVTGTLTKTVTGTSTAEILRGNMADNDQFRILIGGTATNAGYVEIATADDGTEPIYVRQYTGTFSSITRTATLLDGSGNTTFPGSVTANSFVKSGGTSSQFLKANGSVDSNQYVSLGRAVAMSLVFGG